MRVLLETASLRQCFSLLSQTEFDILREYNLHSRLLLLSKTSTARDLWDDNMQFHRTLYSFSKNEFGMTLLERCMQMQTMAYVQLYRFTRDSNRVMTTTSHEGIAALIESSNLEGTVRALQNDIRSIQPTHPEGGNVECAAWN